MRPFTAMRIRFYISTLILISSVSIAAAQSTTVDVESSLTDSTSIPTLAELKSEFLQQGKRQVPGQLAVPSEHRAFFCRFDDQLDKKRIPLRMRLGSVEEVNRLEGKPGYILGHSPN